MKRRNGNEDQNADKIRIGSLGRLIGGKWLRGWEGPTAIFVLWQARSLPLPLGFQVEGADQAEEMVGMNPEQGGCFCIVPTGPLDGPFDNFLLGLAQAFVQRGGGPAISGSFLDNGVGQILREDVSRGA